MATVAQVAQASLGKILVQASEQPIESVELQDYIFSMNNFMLALDAEGISLGYTEVSKASDKVTIPAGALRGLINNMAIEVVDDYDGVVTQSLVKVAADGMLAMRRLGQRLGSSFYPGTLPVGSGNEGSDIGRTSHFYADREAEILAETTGSIGLESDTP